jgi:nitroreductase
VELHEAIDGRRMTRNFRPTPIDDAVVEGLLGVVAAAPSAGFSQGVELLALRSAERRERFWSLASSPQWRAEAPQAAGLMAAPLIVIPLGEPAAYARRYGAPDKADSLLGGRTADEWPVPYWIVDASFAAMLVLLAAEDAGLGGLFFQLHGAAEEILGGLGVPEGRVAIGALAIGERADEVRRAPRPARPRAALVHLDDYR